MQHTKPCNGCPWRKDSAKGWVGAATPVEFLQTSEAEHRMPCHNTVDYEAENWEAQINTAPQCVGRAVHFANRCKIPKSLDLILARSDREQVFSNPQDFIDHHTLGEPVKIQIVGNHVRQV